MDTKVIVVGPVGIQMEEARKYGIREASHEVTRESCTHLYEDYYVRRATMSRQPLIGMSDEAYCRYRGVQCVTVRQASSAGIGKGPVPSVIRS